MRIKQHKIILTLLASLTCIPHCVQIEKVSVSHDGRQPTAGWYLEEVTVDVPSRGDHTVFPSHCWLASSPGDGKIVRDFVSRPCKYLFELNND